MKTNAFFNLNRFVALARQDLLLNRNKYWLALAVAFGAIYLAIIYQMQRQPNGFIVPLETMNFNRLPGWGYTDQFLLILLGLGAFIGAAFSGFNSKPRTSSFLMLPASTFEKYTYPFVFRVVFGLALFALIFWVDAQLARWTMLDNPTYLQNNYVILPFEFSMFFDVTMRSNDNWLILFSVASIGMFLYVVPLFFKKQALIKTVLAFFALLFAYVTCLVLFSHVFYPETKGYDISLKEFRVTDQMNSILLMFHILVDTAWLFLLFIGYFKLKEKRL